MLRSLSTLPPTVPTLEPFGSGLMHGPRYALERLPDVGGTAAAAACWQFWQSYGEPGSHLLIPASALVTDDPFDPFARGFVSLQRGASHEAEGAGYLLFADMSVLIVQRSDRRPWGRMNPEPEAFVVLPIVFRICPVITTRQGRVRLQVVQDQSGVSLDFRAAKGASLNQTPDVVTNQIAREVGAWAAWIARTPCLAPPSDEMPGTDWPSFFSRSPDTSPRMKSFERDVIDAASSVLAWLPDVFHQVQISVWSARPLQGGIEPMHLALNWQMTSKAPPYQTEALSAHVHELVFGPDTPWCMDDFPACRMTSGLPGDAHTASCELFSHVIAPQISNHRRLMLQATFPAPPPPPPLPGAQGYGSAAHVSASPRW